MNGFKTDSILKINFVKTRLLSYKCFEIIHVLNNNIHLHFDLPNVILLDLIIT